MRLRVTRRAVVARHLLALDDARRIGARSDGTRPAMLRVAVRVRTTTNAVALDDALKASALRRSGHLYRIADGKYINLDDVADVVARDFDLRVARFVEANAAQNARRRIESGLLRVTDGRQRGAMPLRRPL